LTKQTWSKPFMDRAVLPALLAVSVFLLALPGVSAAAGPLSVAPERHDYGITSVGGVSADQVFTITNRGGAALVPEIILSDKSNYSLDLSGGPSPCGKLQGTLAPGQSCTVSVRFEPLAQKIVDATLSVAPSGGGKEKATASLTGFGIVCGC
jgi:hypothetical protein